MGTTTRELRRRVRVLLGLTWIGALESLGDTVSRILTAPGRRRRTARARRELARLRPWTRISEASYVSYTGAPSMVRLDRLRRLLSPGSRILDVGIGFGYVTGVLLRDVRPASYLGIDVKELFIEATRDMIEHNRLDSSRVELAVGDVFDLDRDLVARTDPDTVLLLEVLEHIEAPEEALRSVAGAVRAGTKVIFTVPLKDRLDGVWGHVAVFDRRRVQRMCEAAALEMERVEAIHNTWTLALARTTGPELPPSPAAGYSTPANTFRSIDLNGPSRRFRRPGERGSARLRADGTKVRCKLEAEGSVPSGAGMRLPATDPRVIRAEMRVKPRDASGKIEIDAYDAHGAWRTGWGGDPASIATDRNGRFTVILRPGRDFGGLATRGSSSADGVRHLDIGFKPSSAQDVELTLHRAAYLQDGSR